MSVADPHYFTVAEDIRYLQRTWADGVPTEKLRRDSPILRRLLVDGGQGVLFHIWRQEYGFEGHPTVVGPDLRAETGGDLSIVALGVAGGANIGGTEAANIAIYKQATTPEPLDIEDGTTAERNWKLLDYVDAPGVIVNEQPISRREIIQYWAHFLGGVHLSPDVNEDEEEMVERLHVARGTIVNGMMRVGEIPINLEYELLSIGQIVANSDDVNRLVEAIEERRRSQ